jgi:hypothetical protein
VVRSYVHARVQDHGVVVAVVVDGELYRFLSIDLTCWRGRLLPRNHGSSREAITLRSINSKMLFVHGGTWVILHVLKSLILSMANTKHSISKCSGVSASSSQSLH